MKFLHISDVHLGLNQYQLEDRVKDFGKAWADVLIKHAINNQVDFVLIAGDLFDKRTPPPRAFDQAFSGLAALRDRGIPAVAIEGNHDETQDSKGSEASAYSWLRSLRNCGLLKLLEPTESVNENGEITVIYEPWNDEENTGSYIDVAGARIFGSRWYGHSLNKRIQPIVSAIEANSHPDLFNILMLHTDIENHTRHGRIAALSMANLNALKSCTNYVALGHTHKRIEIDNWAFNPGSLEACKVDEYMEERGAYLVEVDREKNVSAKIIHEYHQRSFARVIFHVDGLHAGEQVTEGVLATVAGEVTAHDSTSGEPAPIVEITLKGHLGFPNNLLEFDKIRNQVQQMIGALHVRLRNNTVPVEYAVGVDLSEDASRETRERRAIEDLIQRDNRYKANHAEMAELIIGAKRMALSDDQPDKILEYISAKTVESQEFGESRV